MKTAIRLTIILLCVLFLSCLSTGCRCPLLSPTLYKYRIYLNDIDDKNVNDAKILGILKEIAQDTELSYVGVMTYSNPKIGTTYYYYNKKMGVSVYFIPLEEEIYISTTNKSEYLLLLLKCLKDKLDSTLVKYTLKEDEEVLPFLIL